MVGSGLFWSGLVWPGLVWSSMLRPGVVWSGLAWSGLVWSGLSWYGPAWSGLVRYGLVLVRSVLVWDGIGGGPEKDPDCPRRNGVDAGRFLVKNAGPPFDGHRGDIFNHFPILRSALRPRNVRFGEIRKRAPES